MATRTIYLTVRPDTDNPKANEITDEEVDEIISEVDNEELYAELDYASGDTRKVPAKDFHTGALFEAFSGLLGHL